MHCEGSFDMRFLLMVCRMLSSASALTLLLKPDVPLEDL
jgi:hypothetical protein